MGKMLERFIRTRLMTKPALWNVTNNSLLSTEMPEETCLVGYADDVAGLVAAWFVVQVQLKPSRVM